MGPGSPLAALAPAGTTEPAIRVQSAPESKHRIHLSNSQSTSVVPAQAPAFAEALATAGGDPVITERAVITGSRLALAALAWPGRQRRFALLFLSNLSTCHHTQHLSFARPAFTALLIFFCPPR